MYEVYSKLINIDSGSNHLIFRLCAWFGEINKNAKSNLSTASKSGGVSMDGVSLLGNFICKVAQRIFVNLVSVVKLGYECLKRILCEYDARKRTELWSVES